ncbi:penicillin-binding protein activator [Orbus sturtevantii]|uniref:penicillin-binding protein activator n=1 Tax=Orbus sturtevantii TaxID=3074109 RepID=UPI00370D8E76
MLKSYSFNIQSYAKLVSLKIVFVIMLVSFLAGCPTNVTRQLDFDETQTSQYYLSQLSSSSGDAKISWQLLAIRSLILEEKLSQADLLINELPSDLNSMQQNEAILLRDEIAIKSGKNFDLANIRFTDLNEEQKIRFYKIKIVLDEKQHDVNAQLRNYIELAQYGSIEQRHETINDTWNFLRALDELAIESILVYANEPVLQGWVDLIYTYNNNANLYQIDDSDDADTIAKKEEEQFKLIKNAVSEWQLQYSTHPAALYLPRNIYGDKYRLPDNVNHKSVALFLPLSGSSKVFGDAIRLGYSEASQFYTQQPQQNIYVYDTNGNDLDLLVKQAQQQGVELIVGPLLKQDVLAIMKLSPSIPVLALNQIDSSDFAANKSNQICFFSLSPEDEARDTANYIYNQNKKTPLLIVPRNDLGERVAKSFAEQWDLTDPSANSRVYVQYFDSEKSLSNQINSGNGIELEGTPIARGQFNQFESEQLDRLPLSSGEAVDSLSIANIDNPKFDAIYIYASHNELALIKSMLDMKSNKMERDENGNLRLDNKGNAITVTKVIPSIYASSRSNSADTNQDFRYDMERVQFSDIPLIISQNQLVEQLPKYIKNDYSLVRLYAMGVDAWQLANHFNQLQPYQIDVFDGMTGKLSVGSNCEITRTLLWYQYLNGKDIIVQ